MNYKEITDVAAESVVVATLMYHPEFIVHSPHLRHEHFADTVNGIYYWAIGDLYLNKNVREVTAQNIEQVISSDKRKTEQWNACHSTSVYDDLALGEVTKCNTVESYMIYVTSVINAAFKRMFYIKAQDWQRQCCDPSITLDGMSESVYKDLSDLTTRFVTRGNVDTIGSQLDSLWQETIDRHERGESYGLPSAFEHMREFYSFERGEMVVVSSRMKNGKSWLALIEAVHKAKLGIPTMIFDSEMSDANWEYRALGYLSGIPESRIKNYEVSPEERLLIERAIEELKTLPIYHVFNPVLTNEQIYSLVAQKQMECDLGFVIYDYLKPSGAYMEAAQRSAELGSRTDFLKNQIAVGRNIPVLAFCQLNRNNEVADSDYIERYCSVSVRWELKNSEEINRDGVECGSHKATVRLNRLGKVHMGEGDYVDFRFRPHRPGIEEAKQHADASPYIDEDSE